MSYLALYRKYRPASFDEVRGQEHIVTSLRNQLRTGRIGHAYLFCGTRGTGKTSVAKLFAKAVNCENPVDGNPCGECSVCKAIEAQVSMNVMEIDAASNNSVDNIRDIVDEVRYSPTEGRYKVYIIDEVHMLSTSAFNALLKTLEEPPSYVIFILATTEVHKIPITILSRCQRYDFKRITVDRIAECLAGNMKAEGIEADEKALRYVAKAADGSMRDAQSLLDQCIAFYMGETLTYEKVLEVLGTVDVETFAQLLRYIRKGSVDECMEVLDDIIQYGRELTQFVNDFAWYLRNLLIAKTTENPAEVLEFSADRMELLLHEAAITDEEILIRYIRLLSELSGQIRYAAQKRLLVEIFFIKLCKPEMETDYSALVNRIKNLEEQLASGNITIGKETGKKSEEAVTRKQTQDFPKALSEDLKAVGGQWKLIISKMPPMCKAILSNVVPSANKDNKLMLVFDNPVDRDTIAQESRLAQLKSVIADVIGKSVDIELKMVDEERESIKDYTDISKLVKMQIEYVD